MIIWPDRADKAPLLCLRRHGATQSRACDERAPEFGRICGYYGLIAAWGKNTITDMRALAVRF